MKQLKIGIFETGQTDKDLILQHGDFPYMVETWLKRSLPMACFHTIRISSGDAIPTDLQDFDGFVITGSPHGVYENLPWMNTLKKTLRQLADMAKPIFGICFGHQILAEAFGGKVQKSHKGWGIGVDYYLIPSIADKPLPVYVYHQDQIQVLPKGAKLLGGSQHCEYGVLEYEFPCISVQFHPEFYASFMQELVQIKEKEGTDKLKRLSELKTETVDNVLFSKWVSNFFNNNA